MADLSEAPSDDPTDHLIRQLIETGHPASSQEIEQIRMRMAAVPFDQRVRSVPAKLRGMIVDGEILGARAESLLVHLAQRIDNGQWHSAATRTEFLADLRQAVQHQNSRVVIYQRRGGPIAAALAEYELPLSRRGVAPHPYLFVVYSADRGILITGYQTAGPERLTFGENIRWLT